MDKKNEKYMSYINIKTIMQGIYKHVRTGVLYKVVGMSRSIENPLKEYIVYQQLQPTKLRGTNIVLNRGQLWHRELEDFEKKFEYDGTNKDKFPFVW